MIAFAFAASYKWFHKASFFYIACFAAGTILMSAGEALRNRPLPRQATQMIEWMSGISYAVYLNHYLVYRFLKDWLVPEYRNWVTVVYLVILILYSMLTAKAVKMAESGMRTIWARIGPKYAQ